MDNQTRQKDNSYFVVPRGMTLEKNYAFTRRSLKPLIYSVVIVWFFTLIIINILNYAYSYFDFRGQGLAVFEASAIWEERALW